MTQASKPKKVKIFFQDTEITNTVNSFSFDTQPEFPLPDPGYIHMPVPDSTIQIGIGDVEPAFYTGPLPGKFSVVIGPEFWFLDTICFEAQIMGRRTDGETFKIDIVTKDGTWRADPAPGRLAACLRWAWRFRAFRFILRMFHVKHYSRKS